MFVMGVWVCWCAGVLRVRSVNGCFILWVSIQQDTMAMNIEWMNEGDPINMALPTA